MPTPMPPPPLPDPDDDIEGSIDPGMANRGGARRRRSASSASSGRTTYPSFFAQLNRRAWVVIGVLAAVIIGAIVVLATRGDDKGKPTLIETDRAVATLESLLDGVTSSKELPVCPFGSVSDLVGDLNDELKFPGPTADDIHRIVIDGADSVNELLCSAGTADDRVHVVHTLYVYATPVPKGSYPDYLTKVRLLDAVVKVESGTRFNGGTIYAYCITGSPDIKAGCGADWVADDSRLVLGLQVTGAAVTANSVTTSLMRELPTMAERLGDQAGREGDVEPPTTGVATSSEVTSSSVSVSGEGAGTGSTGSTGSVGSNTVP